MCTHAVARGMIVPHDRVWMGKIDQDDALRLARCTLDRIALQGMSGANLGDMWPADVGARCTVWAWLRTHRELHFYKHADKQEDRCHEALSLTGTREGRCDEALSLNELARLDLTKVARMVAAGSGRLHAWALGAGEHYTRLTPDQRTALCAIGRLGANGVLQKELVSLLQVPANHLFYTLTTLERLDLIGRRDVKIHNPQAKPPVTRTVLVFLTRFGPPKPATLAKPDVLSGLVARVHEILLASPSGVVDSSELRFELGIVGKDRRNLWERLRKALLAAGHVGQAAATMPHESGVGSCMQIRANPQELLPSCVLDPQLDRTPLHQAFTAIARAKLGGVMGFEVRQALQIDSKHDSRNIRLLEKLHTVTKNRVLEGRLRVSWNGKVEGEAGGLGCTAAIVHVTCRPCRLHGGLHEHVWRPSKQFNGTASHTCNPAGKTAAFRLVMTKAVSTGASGALRGAPVATVSSSSPSAVSTSLQFERRGFKKVQDAVTTDTAAARRSTLRVLLEKEGALPVMVLRSYLQAEGGHDRLVDVKTVTKLVQEMVKDGELASIDDDNPIRQGNTLAVVTSPNLEADALPVTRLFAALATGDTTWRKIASRLTHRARAATRTHAPRASVRVPTEQERLAVAAKRDYLQGLALRLGWVPGRAVRAQRLHGILLAHARLLSAAPLIGGHGDSSAGPRADCSDFAPLRIDDAVASMAVTDFLMLFGIGDEPPDTAQLLHIVLTSELEPLAMPVTIRELHALLRNHLLGSANTKRRLHHLLMQLLAIGLLDFDPAVQPRSVVLRSTAVLHAQSASTDAARAYNVSPPVRSPLQSHELQQFALAVAQESAAFWEALHSYCQNKRVQHKRNANRGIDLTGISGVPSALPRGVQPLRPSPLAFPSSATEALKTFSAAADWSGVRPLTTAQRRLLQAEFGFAPATGFSTAHGHCQGTGAADVFSSDLDQLRRPPKARPTTSGELLALANRLQVHPQQLRHFLLLTDVKAAHASLSVHHAPARRRVDRPESSSTPDERRGIAPLAFGPEPVHIKIAATKKPSKRQRVTSSQPVLTAAPEPFVQRKIRKVDWAPTQRIQLFEGFVNELIRLLAMRQPSSRAVTAATAHEAASSRPSDEVLQRSAARAGVELVVGFVRWDDVAKLVGQPACNCRLMLHRMLVSGQRSITSARRSLRVCLAALLVRKLRITVQAPHLHYLRHIARHT